MLVYSIIYILETKFQNRITALFLENCCCRRIGLRSVCAFATLSLTRNRASPKCN